MNRLLTKIRLLAALHASRVAILIFVISVSITFVMQVIGYFSNQSKDQTSYCVSNREAILRSMDAIKKCNTDNDCVVAHFNCPFSCNIIINKQQEKTVKSTIQLYNNHCGFCVEECGLQPKQGFCSHHECVAK